MGLLLSPDHTATLTDPETWQDNPFVARDTRRDFKKNQPFITFCWMCGILFLVGPWTAWLIWTLQSTMKTSPLIAGCDLGTGLCIVISGIQVWFIIGASRKHTARQFTEEANQNTLSSLLLLPVSPFQILVQSMAYPWIAGMRLAAAMLPIYVFCVALDGPSLAELGALYVVFAMAALSVPYWTRPALSENVMILVPPKQISFGLNRAQAQAGQANTARSMNAAGGLALGLLAFPILLAWVFVVASGGQSAAQEALRQYLPYAIIVLLDKAVIAWPLLAARILISPLDWFGIKIIPLVFVLVLFLAGKYVELVRASEFLSIGAFRDLPMQATYLPRLRLQAAVRIAMALIIVGYLWKWLVVNGALASLAPPVVGTSAGLGGFAFLLLSFASFWGVRRGDALGQRQFQPLIRGERQILCRATLWDVARYLCEPFLFAAAFFLLCCLLSQSSPSPAFLGARAGSLGPLFMEVIFVGLSGSVLSLGVGRLFGPLSPLPRFAVPALVAIGVYYQESSDVRAFLGKFPAVAHALSFVPHLRSLEIFSPFLGVLQSFSNIRRLLPGAPPWYVWTLVGLGVGGALWCIGHLLGRRAVSPGADSVTLVFNPTILGREAFSDPVQLKKSGIGRADTPVVLAFIDRLQRTWDNAVATRELRSRLRGQWERSLLLTILCFSVGVSFLLLHPSVAFWPTIFGGGVAWALMGPMSGPGPAAAAGILGCWYLVLFIAAFCNAFTTTGAFYAETQKSTLGFLLSTPMPSREIALGKAFGILGPSLSILGAISVWTLLLTLLFVPLVGAGALLGWVYAVASSLTFYLMINGITFAISAMFPKLSMAGSAWVWVLLFWFGIGPMAWIFAIVFAALVSIGLQGASLWFAFVATGWALILLAFTISVSSIDSMRKKDLTFATSKRNN